MDPKKKRLKEIGIAVFTLVLLVGYVVVNRDTLLDRKSVFLLTTVGMFMWLVLVVLMLIHEICEELKQEMGYTIEDNIVEIKLLKDLTEKQIEEMHMLHHAVEGLMGRKKSVSSSPSKPKKKKRK